MFEKQFFAKTTDFDCNCGFDVEGILPEWRTNVMEKENSPKISKLL